MRAVQMWTLGKIDKQNIEACEIWVWRRMERIKLIDVVINEEVFKLIMEVTTVLKESVK